MPAVAIVHKQHILERVAKGDRLRDIAQDLGVSRPAISQQLANDPDYRAAHDLALEARLEAREIELEEAPDALTLARARELLSHQRWRCERENPRRWGNKQQAEVSVTLADAGLVGVAGDLLQRVKGRIIDVAPQQNEGECNAADDLKTE